MQKMREDTDVKKGKRIFAILVVCSMIAAGIVFYDDGHLRGKEMRNVEQYADEETVIRVETEIGTEKKEYLLDSTQKAALQELILDSEFSKKQSMYIGMREEKYRIVIGVLTSDTRRELLCIESNGYSYCHIWGYGESGIYKIENPEWEERLAQIIGMSPEEKEKFLLRQEM